MKTTELKKTLEDLFENWANEKAISFTPIDKAGSNRIYYRISGDNKTAIGVFNKDMMENEAFIQFSKSFLQLGLQVPEIYRSGPNKTTYLIEDLGNQTLFDLRIEEDANTVSDTVLEYYKKSLSELLKFQFIPTDKIDYNHCYPRAKMDRQSILWDLNYFKYYFLKPKNILFDEQKLEDDFHRLRVAPKLV